MTTSNLIHSLTPLAARGQRAIVLAGALWLALVLLLWPGLASATTYTTSVSGRFTFGIASPLACPPVALLCATGTFTGSLQGSFTNALFYLSPAPTLGVAYYDGKITLITSTGALFCDLDGALNTLSSTGEFGEICVITGGTGVFNQASGHLRLIGISTSTQPPILGEAGKGDYKGIIITPQPLSN